MVQPVGCHKRCKIKMKAYCILVVASLLRFDVGTIKLPGALYHLFMYLLQPMWKRDKGLHDKQWRLSFTPAAVHTVTVGVKSTIFYTIRLPSTQTEGCYKFDVSNWLTAVGSGPERIDQLNSSLFCVKGELCASLLTHV